MSIAIKVENLSKKYVIGHQKKERYTALRDVLANGAKGIGQKLFHAVTGKPILNQETPFEEFWALDDVSFEIKHGERVGIIGRNGAGKSTLLKILSRITEPTSGRVTINGRVASLLEVGTGFHPELTGRENIYLNGAILGMTKVEIMKKFDEIVAFSEVEKFLDTPVKRYSSGMHVRLAFAVAAHLEPEILIVDEVLAVGDAQFQKKCLGKMESVASEGRTVLFVSHNMGAINSLCTSGICLNAGKIVQIGEISSVVDSYMLMGENAACEREWLDVNQAPGDDVLRLKSVRILSDGIVSGSVSSSEDVFIEIEFWNKKNDSLIHSSVHIIDQTGVEVLATGNGKSATLEYDGWFGRAHPVGIFKTICKIPKNFLNDRAYSVNVILLTDVSRVHVYVKDAVSFTVHDSGEMRDEFTGHWLGIIRPKLDWRTEYLSSM